MDVDVEERGAARAELTAAVAKRDDINTEVLAAIRRCKTAGLKVTVIARIVGVHRETIYRWTEEKAVTETKSRDHIAILTRPECCSDSAEEICEPKCMDITVECPGVTDYCRMWWDCETCEPSTADARNAFTDEGLDEIHGVEHKLIDGRLMTPTDRCYVATHDSLGEAVGDLAVPPGRYPIEHDCGDGTELYLSVIETPETVGENNR